MTTIQSEFARIKYDPSRAYGPYWKPLRKSIMESITGRKVLSSKCGFNAFMDLCYATYYPHKGENCIAVDERNLANAVRAHFGIPPIP